MPTCDARWLSERRVICGERCAGRRPAIFPSCFRDEDLFTDGYHSVLPVRLRRPPACWLMHERLDDGTRWLLANPRRDLRPPPPLYNLIKRPLGLLRCALGPDRVSANRSVSFSPTPPHCFWPKNPSGRGQFPRRLSTLYMILIVLSSLSGPFLIRTGLKLPI